MATHFKLAHPRAALIVSSPLLYRRRLSDPFLIFTKDAHFLSSNILKGKNSTVRISRIGAADGGGDSYLEMWKKAMERERKSAEFERMAENTSDDSEQGTEESDEELERRNNEFKKLLEFSVEERDKIQKIQVIDRAAAAIAAARALVKDNAQPQVEDSGDVEVQRGGENGEDPQEGIQNGSSLASQSRSIDVGTPGPSFWTWEPPPDDDGSFSPKLAGQTSPSPARFFPVLEKERSSDIFSIPFQTTIPQTKYSPFLPPLQSSLEIEKSEFTPHLEEQNDIEVQFSAQAAEAAQALNEANQASSQGVVPDGSKWWKETGIEQRPDGVLCKWTLIRGVSSDKAVEWENKYWEASDEFGYKELGSEKSGRDAAGNVWREHWRETMSQNEGIVYLEKTAEKWGKNNHGSEWQEKWLERYGAGKAEKWADKWCSIDPYTPLDAGHAHVWHERLSLLVPEWRSR
ncbi:protein LIKE EARLY STARVATION, chloroplastic isoform X2 [Primulina tabacum]|uniref:protein LIKE EARLY STARVATION, chloroplastic isoform X2 n=1 Tax=Primulina tabacum TaxID=48773 RepID=UPI003F5AD9D0